jgi:ATP/ADP translocase
LAEWSLSTESEKATAIAVYAHMAVFGSAIGSAFWSLVNERFDPHEAKRNVGRIASGGTVGGIVGGLLVWRASAHLSVAGCWRCSPR